MKWLRRFLQILVTEQSYVVLACGGSMHDCHWVKARATFAAGEWFASPYMPDDTRTRLLPDGKCEGPGYVHRWRPFSGPILEQFRGDSNG